MEEFFNTDEIPEIDFDTPAFVMGGKVKIVLKNVNIEDIYINPENLPKNYKTEDLASLAMDILKNGLKKPIVVISINRKKEIFQIISGEKRFRACLLARLENVLCTVIYSVSNNISIPPRNYFERAKFYAEAIDRGIYDEENIAKKVNLSTEEIKSILFLLVFSEEEQEILINHGVPEQSAIKLAKMDFNTRKGFLETITHGTNIAAVCAKINEVSEDEEKKTETHFKKMKFCIRGNGFFVNSINHAVETMREGGVNVDCNSEETDTDTILTLTIPKQ